MKKNLLFAAVAVLGLAFFGATQTEAGHRCRSSYSFGYGGISVHSSYYGGSHRGYHRSYHRSPTWHNTSHYDYHGPSYQRHRNHYHYVPGHYDYHRTGHWDY